MNSPKRRSRQAPGRGTRRRCRTRASRTSDRNKAAQASIAAALSAAAERIEGITKKLNQTVATSGVALG